MINNEEQFRKTQRRTGNERNDEILGTPAEKRADELKNEEPVNANESDELLDEKTTMKDEEMEERGE